LSDTYKPRPGLFVIRGIARAGGSDDGRRVLAIIAPGQGAQAPGMLAPWLDLPGVASRLRWFSAVTGLDLIRLGTTAGADEIKDTAVTQPLLVATALAVAPELELPEAAADVVTAGHSVGELAAAGIAGVLPAEAAVALAALRGRAMAEACALAPTGMSAVLGGDPDEVVATLEAYGLTAANRNGAGQIVAAGALDGLAKLAENPPERAKVRPLPVAGAFHTAYMASADEQLTAVAGGIAARDPHLMLLSNADGTAVPTGAEVVSRLVHQVTRPVRWDLCQATLRHLGVTALIELPAAGTLAGLARRELGGVEIVAVKTPDDLVKAGSLVSRGTHGGQAEHTPDWRVVIAPSGGTFVPEALIEGTAVGAGSPIGVISTRREDLRVSAGYAGVLVEWLVQEGDLVAPGEPLARLVPGSDSDSEETR
jgi:[acyl-carrier-protein] S-malonyltransferase